jgi:hypothetical protein
MPAPASAAGNTLRIEPVSSAVAEDATFTARVVQQADVATSGAQATVTFDPALLQVTNVSRGGPYADAPVVAGISPAAITAANSSGRLAGVAAAFLPPDSVPAGEADFLVIEFKAIGCGRSELGLPVGPTDAALLDGRDATYGEPLPLTTIGGSVTTCVTSASPTPGTSPSPGTSPTPGTSPSPGTSPTPSPSGGATPSPAPTPPPLPAGNSLRIEPWNSGVARSGTFTLKVVQKTDVATSGAQATVTFDPALLQVTAVTRGAPYASAPVFVAGGPSAITAANSSGRLAGVAAAFLPPGSVPAGEADFLVIEFKAISCGQSELGLPVGPSDAALVDGRAATYGAPLEVATRGGIVTTCAAGATIRPSPTPSPTPRPTPVPPAYYPPAQPAYPPPGGGVAGETSPPLPTEEPTPATTEPASAGAATPSPIPALAALSPGSPSQPDGRTNAIRTVAMVAVGVAGIGFGLLVVLVLAAILVAAIVVPVVVVRLRSPGG